VLAAHVDTAEQGAGAFFRLRELRPGDEVVVDYDDGSSGRFIVEARVTYDKDSLPLHRVFARDGSPVLTLVTCGGGFSRSSRSYDSNVVVYAVPADEAGRRAAAT
jgi:sortase (surface protein transpeptidase)